MKVDQIGGPSAAALLVKLKTVDGAGSGLDADLLDGLSSAAFLPAMDTRANILASTPTARTIALSSDTLEMYLWSGSAWYVAPLEFIQQANGIDIGLLPPMVHNDRAGYSATDITDKTIYNSVIGGNARTVEGGIRVVSGVLQAYLLGAWADVMTGFRFREDSAGRYELEHKPVGFTQWIEVVSGNSDDLGLNGLPLTQGYATSIGPYPVHQQIVGREITY